MGLFNKGKYWFILLPVAAITVLIFRFFTPSAPPPPPDRAERLLQIADSSKGSSSALAEATAQEALAISIRENQGVQVVQSWIILGEIQHTKGENQKALAFFNKASQLAREKDLYREWCEAQIETGDIIYDQGGYDSAFLYFRDAEKVAESHQLESEKSFALFYMGKYNETKGHFDQARDLYDQAIKICRASNDERQLALILPSRGKNYLSEGKLNLALQCYMEAFELSGHLHDQLLYAETASHLGGLYLQMEQYDKALEYDKKALLYRSNMNNPDGIAKSYNNIGKAFIELKQRDSAFYYFEQSLAFCEKIHYEKGMVKALTNMGKMYSEDGHNDKAIQLLNRAFSLSSATGYDIGMAESSVSLADIWKKSGQTARAIDAYQLSLLKVKSTGYDELLKSIYTGLYECYGALGDYQPALAYHVSLLQVEKNLLNVENKRQLAVMNISFDLERKEKDNQMLRTDNLLKEQMIKRKDTLMWLIAVALTFTIVLCVTVYKRNNQQAALNNKLGKLNDDLEKANREKDKLFTIIAHELRNPLYWFQNLAEVLSRKFKEMPADRVQKNLSALDESAKNAFHLMDNLLQWSRSQLNRVHPRRGPHPLFDLVTDTADMYQTILQHKELTFYNDIPREVIVHADADLLSCVIRNLISNAIKYTPAQGTIMISCNKDEKFVTVVISDSGTGMSEIYLDRIVESMPGLMEEKGSGLGLKLCKEFVELNGGKLWVKSELNKGTRIYFTVPAGLGAGTKAAAPPDALGNPTNIRIQSYF